MFTGTWQSITDKGIFGTYSIQPNRETMIARVTLNYDSTSKFRPGVTKMFVTQFILTRDRILSQTSLAMEQLFNFTFKFDGPIISGHYATILPMDCGLLKSDQSAADWIEFLNDIEDDKNIENDH